MAEKEEGGMETRENSKTDPPLNKNEILEKLELLVAKTEKIENSQKRKFDEIAEKLQSMEESNPKISKSNEVAEKAKIERTFKLKHVFNNVTEFEENKDNSSEWEDHFNVKWSITLRKFNGYLSFFLHCEPIVPSNKWSIQTKMVLKVVSKDQNDAIMRGDCCYEENGGRGYSKFLEWEKIEEEYLVNGSLTVEADVSIIEKTGLGKEKIREFDESQKEVSDVILVVRNTKFYVSKMYLAAQSSFFKTLFLGTFSESSQSEIALPGIDPNDFHRFLEVLYAESAIDDFSVEGILHIADMYVTPAVVKRCEEFLLEKSKKSAKKLLEMAARYNFQSLKEKCMSDIKTFADFQSILPGDIQTFSPSMMAELLEKTRTLY